MVNNNNFLNVAVIGAGPIGGYAAYLLAKAGHTVSIYENHGVVGCPIQCTGLLTSDFDQFNFPMESFLVNTFNKVEVFSPHGKLEIKQKEYLVSRTKFDEFFVDMAVKAGAKLFLNHTFMGRESNTKSDIAGGFVGNSIIIKDSVKAVEKRITPDIIIAADGPLSHTAKAYDFYHPEREHYFGVQALVQGNFDVNTYQTHFGEAVCPDLFAWIVPESTTTARVGLAMRKNSKVYFDKFLQQHNFKPLEIQAGSIPVYHPLQQLHKDNCYLVGDAAGFVKATTLGGLIPGLKQAEILADCVINGKDYERESRKLARKLKLHLSVRKILDQFKDEDWDTLVSYMNQPRIQKVLEKHTRENPLPLITKILLKEPRFLMFGKYLF